MALRGPKDTHEYQLRKGVRTAEQYLRKATAAARKGDCFGVWDALMVARANVSHAYAHLSSIERPAHGDDVAYNRVSVDLHQAVQTLGFQCTRRRGT